MRELDETDMEILELLAADARRPYSEIGETVGLSGPAVSERVSRLQEVGVIRRFTVDVDRSKLRGGVPVLVTVRAPSNLDALRRAAGESDAVEHVFVSAAGDLVCYALLDATGVREWVGGLAEGPTPDYDVTLLDAVEWTPNHGGTDFALTCAECGNPVTSDGETTRVGDRTYSFCCSSCEERFRERYERLEEGAA